MGVEHQAADVSFNGDAFVRDNVAAAERLEIPATWLGRFVDFTAIGATVFIRFGDDAVDVATTVSSVTDEVITFGGDEPHLVIPDGTTKSARIDRQHTHLAHLASAATGKLYAAESSGDGD
jgi:hypothetical protein